MYYVRYTKLHEFIMYILQFYYQLLLLKFTTKFPLDSFPWQIFKYFHETDFSQLFIVLIAQPFISLDFKI